MNLPTRHMLLGMTLGAICATGLAAIGPGVVIQVLAEERRVGIDSASLVRFADRDYEVQYEDWVDTDPLSTARVKKIEAGRVSWVDITTTTTGTYSSEALVSGHIRYPGISVEPADRHQPANRFSSWDGKSWLSFSAANGWSMIFADVGKALQIGPDSTCLAGKGHRVC